MSIRPFRITTACCALAAALSLGAPTRVAAEPYIAYPGPTRAEVDAIETPMVVHIQAETWPGFRRAFRITLPGIQVPEDIPDAPACQREMAQRALAFTKTFLKDGGRVEVRDIRMQNTAVADGEAHLYTRQGSLAAALEAAGLARPSTVDPDQPWCP